MNRKTINLVFEDDAGEELEVSVDIEWDYRPATYYSNNGDPGHPDESYYEVTNLDELPDWITEDMIWDKIDYSDLEIDAYEDEY